MLKCVDLKCEYLRFPLGIDESHTRFSWKLESSGQNVFQTSYRIQCDSVWDTGIVKSEDSMGIVYSGTELEPSTRYNYKATV